MLEGGLRGVVELRKNMHLYDCYSSTARRIQIFELSKFSAAKLNLVYCDQISKFWLVDYTFDTHLTAFATDKLVPRSNYLGLDGAIKIQSNESVPLMLIVDNFLLC